jgi:membrane-associated phospholipid phosphatase
MRLHRFLDTAKRLRVRFHFGIAELIVGLSGVTLLLGALAVFGGATEDVSQHNGLALRDAGNLRFFTSHRSDLLVQLARITSDAGAVAILGGLAVVASVLVWRSGARLAIALVPTVSFGVAATAVVITKALIGRSRPPASLHLVSESDATFPSGHATDSAAVLMAIALVLAVFVLHRPMMRVGSILAAAVLSGAIGASRLVLGVHWPTDVLAGWALGVGIAIAVTMSAALLARITPPTPDERAGMVRRLLPRVRSALAAERRPRRQLLAT